MLYCSDIPIDHFVVTLVIKCIIEAKVLVLKELRQIDFCLRFMNYDIVFIWYCDDFNFFSIGF